ncbi:MAG: radical SAM protein [Clostridiales bacterium]|jgi:MoaA/NifB/PqqE/SkfB family radical SAM enzyme|nr:radical SAM protein [Eubacteriales bacterium]MDH7564904.1 radical SAM protein [Clostridiales bacterium]
MKASLKSKAVTIVLDKIMDYLDREPMKNLSKALEVGRKLDLKNDYKPQIEAISDAIRNEESSGYKIIQRLVSDIDKNVRNKFISNFLVYNSFVSTEKRRETEARTGVHIPWAVLMDPTTACNLKCKGCWAAEYDKQCSMDMETLDRIVQEGKELGIYMYIFSGGEPLIRKKDLIKLAEKHGECMFLAFTNATLVDQEFAREMKRVGNFALAISVEGFEAETDMRRGEGTFRKVIEAMDLLKKEKLIYGFSTCYHSKNVNVIGSDAYLDLMVEKGCSFGWYFTYVPIGKDAVPELIASPEQREFMYRFIRDVRSRKPIFVLDFWNDGEYVQGCIAGGKQYLHINANGDVEPCAFIHFSDINIKENSLLDCLKSPLLHGYQKRQPFNENHLRPCPMLDNPEILRAIVKESGARPTQQMDEETVEELTAKCENAAKKWAPVAEKLWNKSKGVNAGDKEYAQAVNK